MSYQTSIHFDPTALLIIKKEVDNSIQLVESAVSSLVEDQALPFGIDDALAQFEQCAQVLLLIDMPSLTQITTYCAELMRKIMKDPRNIQTPDVIALSEGTTMLKRYIEFSSLREVKVPQFLIDTLNRLEVCLGKPLTQEGQAIVPLLDRVNPEFNLPQAITIPRLLLCLYSKHLIFTQHQAWMKKRWHKWSQLRLQKHNVLKYLQMFVATVI